MNELAQLKKQIAALASVAGSDLAPVPKDVGGRVAQFLGRLPDREFDAIHIAGQVVLKSYGSSEDMISLALVVASKEQPDASAFCCEGTDDPTHLIFCASHAQETVALRTTRLSLDQLLGCWQNTN